jgi:hypothetical protein
VSSSKPNAELLLFYCRKIYIMVVVVISGLVLKLKIDARVSVRKVKEEARWRLDCCVESAE